VILAVIEDGPKSTIGKSARKRGSGIADAFSTGGNPFFQDAPPNIVDELVPLTRIDRSFLNATYAELTVSQDCFLCLIHVTALPRLVSRYGTLGRLQSEIDVDSAVELGDDELQCAGWPKPARRNSLSLAIAVKNGARDLPPGFFMNGDFDLACRREFRSMA